MGYCMQQGDTRFRISHTKMSAALGALNRLAASGQTYSWVYSAVLAKAQSVKEHLAEWRWNVHQDVVGNITGLSFSGEKLGDDLILFQALAPVVDAGSFIVMHGEDGDCWRWYFDGATCVEQNAQIGFGPVPGDVIDGEAREVPEQYSLPSYSGQGRV